MLKLLLDEHVSAQVAKSLRREMAAFTVIALSEWYAGKYLGVDDATILRQAATEGLTLASYDVHSIPELLKEWMGRGRRHAGATFVHSSSIPQNDVGLLMRSLNALFRKHGEEDWTNRIFFLQRIGR